MRACAAAALLCAAAHGLPTPTNPIRYQRVPVSGGQTLNVALAGSAQPKEAVLMLHGYPEASWLWRGCVDPLLRDTTDRMIIMPDQRGFNTSSKPGDVHSYNLTAHLVPDAAALVKALVPQGVKVDVVGHDWGGPVAWAFVSMHPELVRTLSILNGPHPNVFFSLLHNASSGQRKDSAYMILMDSSAGTTIFGPSGLNGMFDKESWYDPETKAAMNAAWGQEGAVVSGLNWYRCNMFSGELNVPGFSDTVPPSLPPLRVSPDIPTLVIWGTGDNAFVLPANLDNLAAYVPDLTIKKYAGVGHWIAQAQPDRVSADINEHIAAHR
eukprot:TRINITY_DN12447_c0_g1_i1.p1 TRINITY_DN12447_c0_g1~~TRINITY_DN12447_c0_g1_i1.p1  ORF type:complete len:351 (+),score=114.84 TRINITY_DN12447_c0_g1_i1:84-1055(+)